MPRTHTSTAAAVNTASLPLRGWPPPYTRESPARSHTCGLCFRGVSALARVDAPPFDLLTTSAMKVARELPVSNSDYPRVPSDVADLQIQYERAGCSVHATTIPSRAAAAY